jgi:ribosomal protein S18 acetylase RimI-like enzyme
MIDRYLTETPWIALAIWVVLYLSDYYLTIWGATLRKEKAAALIDTGGSYELTPVFRADVDALRWVSPTFLWHLFLSVLVLLFVWWLTVRHSEFPPGFLFVVGALVLLEVAVHIRHVRNILFFRALRTPGATEGHIRHSQWLILHLSATDFISFAMLFVVCFVVTGNLFFIGGTLTCLATGLAHEQRSRRIPRVRRALGTDTETVARIHVASWNVSYRGIMPDDVIARTDLKYRTAYWAARIADQEWPVFLTEANREGVAFCHMILTKDPDDDPQRVGHITSLHVLPQLRALGYGRALLELVFKEFRQRGIAEVTLWVLEENTKARQFYEKHGFRLDGGRKMYPQTTVPEVRYRIRLPVP